MGIPNAFPSHTNAWQLYFGGNVLGIALLIKCLLLSTHFRRGMVVGGIASEGELSQAAGEGELSQIDVSNRNWPSAGHTYGGCM